MKGRVQVTGARVTDREDIAAGPYPWGSCPYIADIGARELAGGAGARPLRVDLGALGEPQGEGVTIGAGGLVYLVGEGGGRGGTLATLRCTLR
ncbi:MAG: hypothetical protein HYY76_19275 [Acidobacteria bacterium]|nr:hypothetical protein [Acidobacteriota bacterium]